jgi:hypothetical protein
MIRDDGRARPPVLDLSDQPIPLETVMTGAGLNDPDEAIREAERRDLEVERKEEPEQQRGQTEKSPAPAADDGDEEPGR